MEIAKTELSMFSSTNQSIRNLNRLNHSRSISRSNRCRPSSMTRLCSTSFELTFPMLIQTVSSNPWLSEFGCYFAPLLTEFSFEDSRMMNTRWSKAFWPLLHHRFSSKWTQLLERLGWSCGTLNYSILKSMKQFYSTCSTTVTWMPSTPSTGWIRWAISGRTFIR